MTLGSESVVSAQDFDGFPGYVRDAGSVDVVSYAQGTSHTSTDKIIEQRTSADSFATPSTVFDDVNFNPTGGGALTLLSSGDLAIAFDVVNSSDVKIVDGGFTIIRSEGTWGTPNRIDSDYTAWALASGGVCELANGDWLLAVWGRDTGGSDDEVSVSVIKSTNQGTSWTTVAEIADGVADGTKYNESGLIRSGSTIVAFIRDETSAFGFGGTIWRSASTDNGDTWSPLQKVDVGFELGGHPKPWVEDGVLYVGLRRIISATNYPHVLLRSFDLGLNWEKCEGFGPGRSVYSQFGAGGIAYAIEAAGQGSATTYFRARF